jgi:hypothetical protein
MDRSSLWERLARLPYLGIESDEPDEVRLQKSLLVSRMESHGVPGKIQISRATYELTKDGFVCEPRGRIEVKGVGQVETWFLLAARQDRGGMR